MKRCLIASVGKDVGQWVFPCTSNGSVITLEDSLAKSVKGVPT